MAQQIPLVWAEGTYLAARTQDKHIVGLYYLHNFFVEVIYHYETYKMLDIKSFRSKRGLEPYADCIELQLD